jgi:hypothetical protein
MFQIDMTEQVHLLIANVEYLYVEVLDVMVDCYEDATMTDEENISYLSDRIEVLVRDHYLTGEETDEGSWLIRGALDTVAWYQIATLEYGDYLADRGE